MALYSWHSVCCKSLPLIANSVAGATPGGLRKTSLAAAGRLCAFLLQDRCRFMRDSICRQYSAAPYVSLRGGTALRPRLCDGPLREANGVADEHGDRHGADAAGDRRDHAGHMLGLVAADVAD